MDLPKRNYRQAIKAKFASVQSAQADNVPQRAGIQSVEVGFSLLDVLANAGSALMLRDLALQAGMSAAKAHRYLVSFQRLGLVAQDAGTTRYDLGPAALKLGLASLARVNAIKLARQRINPLMGQIGQTLALAVWGNQGPCMVHWEESPQAVTVNLRLGDVMPLLSSATGLCFAAFMAMRQSAVNTRLKGLLEDELVCAQKLGRKDLPASMAEVTALLDEARGHGVARVVSTLMPGVGGFCAPVFDADGHMVLGIVALGSLSTFDTDWRGKVATPLIAAARQLSSDLGYIAA